MSAVVPFGCLGHMQAVNQFKFLTALLAFLTLFSLSAAQANADLTVETRAGERQFSVELALTPDEHAQGLMYRREMADDAGMLFIFDDNRPRHFWMRNTFIPLDIIFIQANGRIVNIVENAEPQTETLRSSKGAAVAVLEINGGLARKLGIRRGNVVKHPILQERLNRGRGGT